MISISQNLIKDRLDRAAGIPPPPSTESLLVPKMPTPYLKHHVVELLVAAIYKASPTPKRGMRFLMESKASGAAMRELR